MLLEDLVPGWVLLARWFLWPALAFLIVWTQGRLALSWLQWRVGAVEPSPHWTERGRRAAVLRHAPLLGLVCGFAASYGAWMSLRVVQAQEALGPALVALFAGLAATSLLGYQVKSRIGLSRGLRAHLRGFAFYLCLVRPAVASAVCLLRWRLRGEPWHGSLFLGGVVVFVGSLAGGGIFLARLLGLVRPAGSAARELLAAECARMGIPARPLLRLDWDQVNAVALPFLGMVAVTRRAEGLFTERELAPILRHELAHLSEGWGAKLVRLWPCALLLGYLPFARNATWRTVVVLVGTAVLLRFAARAFSRRMERRADRLASSGGADFAQALERLHEANLVPAVHAGQASHPALYDRLLAAGRSPDFPRPDPPSRRGNLVGAVLGVASALLGIAVLEGAKELAAVEGKRGPVLVSLALFGPSARDLGRLGTLAWEEDPGRAAACYRAAADLEPGDSWWAFSEAMAEANRGACAEARQAFARAEALLPAGEATTRWDELRRDAQEAVEACEAR